jgi:hypothetical protein
MGCIDDNYGRDEPRDCPDVDCKKRGAVDASCCAGSGANNVMGMIASVKRL